MLGLIAFGALVALVCLGLGLLPYSGNGDGGKTQTAGTLIQYLVQPDVNGKTRITTLTYILGSTAHTLTFLRPIGRTTVVGAAASGQAVVNIAGDPGVSGTGGFGTGMSNGIAANDYVAIRELDGVTRLYKVSSVSTLAITLTANLVAGCVGGESFWDFGITTDVDPRSGSAHPAFLPTVSTTSTYTDSNGGVVSSIGKDEPILFSSSNGTTAGTLLQISWAFTIN